MPSSPASSAGHRGSAGEVLWAFTRLGLTSFGGPVAHLGFFRTEFVQRRRWLSDAAYADLVALCQFLPGPASSQVGMALGRQRAGLLGMIAAWVGFTLPSAALLVAFAFGVQAFDDIGQGWLAGLKAAAVAVVAHALIGMARTLTPDLRRAFIAVPALAVVLLVPHPMVQVGVIVVAGLLGLVVLPRSLGAAVTGKSDDGGADPADTDQPPDTDQPDSSAPGSDKPDDGGPDVAGERPARRRRTRHIVPAASLGLFAALLLGLPALARLTGSTMVEFVDIFYRAGALVFGGGHVVLPLLETQVVGTGMVDADTFLAGYGAAQAVPGPLFTFAGYLGAANTATPSGITGGALALVAIFLPSALLVLAVLPYWQTLRANTTVRRALAGVNAGVVGLLGAALVDPVITQGITSVPTLLLALGALLALWRSVPPWLVVVAAGVLAHLLL